MSSPQLYSYYRSSASYRVRIALYLKKIDFEYIAVHLVQDGGEHRQSKYLQKNPMSQVPCFVHEDETFNQSMAIIQYIDETWTQGPQLFPENPKEKAKVIEFCEIINSGIQPLQNLSVLQKLKNEHNFTSDQIQEFFLHWMSRGAQALEAFLQKHGGQHCWGDKVTAADLFLTPQVYNFNRYELALDNYPLLHQINARNLALEAFQKASPDCQPDTP